MSMRGPKHDANLALCCHSRRRLERPPVCSPRASTIHAEALAIVRRIATLHALATRRRGRTAVRGALNPKAFTVRFA